MNDLTRPDGVMESRRVGGENYPSLPKLPQIPCGRFTDEDFYQLEMKHVFRRTWLQVAHISEFEKAGSYRVLDLPIAPVIIIRGKDGELRAFLNACRHRGARVVLEKAGCVPRLSCQYHGWTYDLTGKLIGIPERETFPESVGKDMALKSVRCERWGGFVFINLDENAPALMDWLGPIGRRNTELMEAPLRIVSKQSWEINCNWKLAADAFRESYHVPRTHTKTSALAVDGYKAYFEIYPSGGTLFLPYTQAVKDFAWKGLTASTSTLTTLPGALGAFSETTQTHMFFPNFEITQQPSGFPLISMWPLAKDRCRVDVDWYGADWGDGPVSEEWNKIVADFTVLTEEDLGNLSSIQESVEAEPGKRFFLSTHECLVYHLHVELDKVIGVENIAPEVRMPDIHFLDDFITH